MKTKGFSLIEVMCAMAILAIGVCGVAQMYFSTITMNKFENDRIQAFKLANQTMENLLSMGVNDIKSYDYREQNMVDNFNGNAFTAVNNRAMSATQSELGTLTENDYDQGLPNTGTANMADYDVNYEPTPSSTTCTSRITVDDLNWDASHQVISIKVEVPELGVCITAVKSDVNL